MNVLDKQSKKILQLKEVFAVILKEYQEYSETEIMEPVCWRTTAEKLQTGISDRKKEKKNTTVKKRIY